ncbi:MAG TPA: alpha/beta hydrolase-fold protein [Ardenticatenaceae bacterium]|nr:alpha/beta hydrolase-fold protein [Ardenticatenaceae bacterium]
MTTIQLSDGTGVVTRHADFPSQHVAPRHVDVWCPPGYAESPNARFPVVYMHDGQNLFDPALANTGIDWGVDEAITRLIQAERLPGAIVVGIWNTPRRVREYMPHKLLAGPEGQARLRRFAVELGGPPLSDQYLAFLTSELKPFVDATYRTLPDQPNTFVMGSSMGGLISLYALVEYPHIFGGAGCLSTHWPRGEELLVESFGAALPVPGRHRLYFDYGTATLDAQYEPYQQRMDGLLEQAGYTRGRDWLTLKFEGADHSERAWRARVHIPLSFLLLGCSTRS